MQSLNIKIQSLELDKNIFNDNDTLRISVTTLPGEQKQAFSFDAKKIQTVSPLFSVRIDEKTEKVLIVIRKKSFSDNDPIIASTVIKNDQFLKNINDQSNIELKTIDFYEPVQKVVSKKITKSKIKRKIVGIAELFFSITHEIQCQKRSLITHFRIMKNEKKFPKIDSIMIFNEENLITN